MTDEKYYIEKGVACICELEQNNIAIIIPNFDFICVVDRNTR